MLIYLEGMGRFDFKLLLCLSLQDMIIGIIAESINNKTCNDRGKGFSEEGATACSARYQEERLSRHLEDSW